MGAPPEFAHLVAITDYLVLVHQASETYVTHSKHNIYFLLKPLEEKKMSFKTNSAASVCTSDESLETLENSKLNKALKNAEVRHLNFFVFCIIKFVLQFLDNYFTLWNFVLDSEKSSEKVSTQ